MRGISTPSKRLKVAIVGGGIGGLSAEDAMLRRGIDVTVWEQADQSLYDCDVEKAAIAYLNDIAT